MDLSRQLVLARDIARHSDLTRLFRECTRAVQSAGKDVGPCTSDSLIEAVLPSMFCGISSMSRSCTSSV
eukprot:21076-Eustigmatos_ZCMA.PRE.1